VSFNDDQLTAEFNEVGIRLCTDKCKGTTSVGGGGYSLFENTFGVCLKVLMNGTKSLKQDIH
jgi:hypothetical protein